MTVGEMRRIMLGKVVPESVVPQNMVDFLIDENAELPEPDAFTFLNRLRGLGIGSADFLYLLEGCGAPAAAVDKIKANPAMNLQGLILTLESSGMTSKDYTRILYTARQIWERTLTLRLETSERISDGEYPDDNAAEEEYAEYEEPSFEKVMDITMTDLKIPSASSGNTDISEAPAASAAPETGSDDPYSDATEELMSVDFDNYDFDNTNTVSLDATMDLGRAAADEMNPDGSTPESAVSANFSEAQEAPKVSENTAPITDNTSELRKAREPFEIHIASYDEPFNDSLYESTENNSHDNRNADKAQAYNQSYTSAEQSVGSNEHYSDDIVAASPEEFHEKKHERFEVKINYDDEEPETAPQEPKPPVQQQYNGETTMIVPIDQEMLKENLAELGRGSAEESERGYAREDDYGETAELPKTAKQLPKKKRELDDNDYRFDDDEQKWARGKKSKIHKGTIIAAAVGAVALIGANIVLGIYLNGQRTRPITYAEDAAAVFTDIYYSYTDNITGGENVIEYPTDYNKIFGNLLICGNGLGSFTTGNNIYSVSSNKIVIAEIQNGELQQLGRFDPADGTKFVAAFEADNSLIAVYSGNECGYLKIKGNQIVYTVRQSGKLTDLIVENGEIKLGSVYTPKFYETFNADKTDVYLPKVGINAEIIAPQDIILSNTKGYSYALSAGYSIADGAVKASKAAMGNPVYASADGSFIMNGSETKRDVTTEYGLLISTAKEAVTERCGKVGCAAMFAGGSAVYEDGGIVLRDREFNGSKKLGNLAKTPTKLRFSGSVLIASDDNGIFLAVDCSDINAPEFLELTQASGSCGNDAAITLEPRSDGVKLTRYVLENGAAKEIASFTRELSNDQAKTLVCGTVNAMITQRDCCGAAYSYFDGVSVISEYVTLSDASEAATLFDDKTGFEYAFVMDGKIYAVCSKGAVDVTQTHEGGEDQPSGNG